MKPRVADELLKCQINEALEQFDEEDFSGLRVNVKDQEVTLMGSVQSQSARRRGEELIRKIRGVRNLVDESRIK